MDDLKKRLVEIIEKAGDDALARHIPLTSTHLADALIAAGAVIPTRCKECECRGDAASCPMHHENDEGDAFDYTTNNAFCSFGGKRNDG